MSNKIDSAFGLIAGMFSALFGIGGGTLNVNYLLKTGLPIKNAVASAAACGLPIALFASIYYIVIPQAQQPLSLGYVYWPAVLAIIPSSLLFAQFGAKLAHKLSAKRLKQLFALLLIIVGSRMAYSSLSYIF